MTKRFKINPDLTCHELAGYKLPELPRRQDVDAETEYPTIGHENTGIYNIHRSMQEGYRKAREKFEFTEAQVAHLVSFANSLGKQGEDFTSDALDRMLDYYRTTHTPIAIEVEMVVNCTGNNDNGCFMDASGHNCGCVAPATNPDGTVKVVKWIFNE